MARQATKRARNRTVKKRVEGQRRLYKRISKRLSVGCAKVGAVSLSAWAMGCFSDANIHREGIVLAAAAQRYEIVDRAPNNMHGVSGLNVWVAAEVSEVRCHELEKKGTLRKTTTDSAGRFKVSYLESTDILLFNTYVTLCVHDGSKVLFEHRERLGGKGPNLGEGRYWIIYVPIQSESPN